MGVKDDKWWVNDYDVVSFDLFGYAYSELINAGYTKIEVKLTMEIKETDAGYQEIGVNNGLDGIVDPWHKMEHGGGGFANKNWMTYNINFSYSLSKFSANRVDIRYGASGSGSNWWWNQNVYVQFVFTK